MMLTPEAREIVRQAALEMFTRRLTADEVFAEVVRIGGEVRTPEEAFAFGQLLGRISAFGQHLFATLAEPGPPPPPPVPEPEPEEEVS